jgi:type I restriction enzyme S subunit
MRAEDYVNHIVGYASGTTVLHLSKDGVPSYLFTKPPSEILKVFNRIARPIYKHIESNRQSSVTIAVIRDALLPKLLSGEIRVKAAEKHIEKMQ